MMDNGKWTVVKVLRGTAKRIMLEAARRTIETGRNVTMGEVATEIIEKHFEATEQAVISEPASAFEAAFVKEHTHD